MPVSFQGPKAGVDCFMQAGEIMLEKPKQKLGFNVSLHLKTYFSVDFRRLMWPSLPYRTNQQL